jgi:hypothetical protein
MAGGSVLGRSNRGKKKKEKKKGVHVLIGGVPKHLPTIKVAGRELLVVNAFVEHMEGIRRRSKSPAAEGRALEGGGAGGAAGRAAVGAAGGAAAGSAGAAGGSSAPRLPPLDPLDTQLNDEGQALVEGEEAGGAGGSTVVSPRRKWGSSKGGTPRAMTPNSRRQKKLKETGVSAMNAVKQSVFRGRSHVHSSTHASTKWSEVKSAVRGDSEEEGEACPGHGS